MRNQILEHIEAKRYSQSSVAKSIGISSSALSQYLSGKYQGNSDEIEQSLTAWLQREKEKELTEKTFVFVETISAKKIYETARYCHIECEIGVLSADAGLGKTTGIKEYARRNSDTILIEADMGYTAKVLFREIAQKLGLEYHKGQIHDLTEDIIHKLHLSGRLIIVDEAENLPYRALEMLRRIHDKAGVGILLCGLPRLVTNLRGRKGEYAQLYSRVGMLTQLRNNLVQDCEALVKSQISCTEHEINLFHKISRGNTRLLTKLITSSKRIAKLNKTAISGAIIEKAASTIILN